MQIRFDDQDLYLLSMVYGEEVARRLSQFPTEPRRKLTSQQVLLIGAELNRRDTSRRSSDVFMLILRRVVIGTWKVVGTEGRGGQQRAEQFQKKRVTGEPSSSREGE